MAQDVSASFPERWSKRIQLLREPSSTFNIIASYEERSNLVSGDIVRRPYATALYARTLPSTGAYTRQELTTTTEYLEVATKKEVSFFLQDYEKIQASVPLTDRFAKNAGDVINNALDGDVLGEYDQADSVIGAYEMDGTGSLADGLGFTLSTSNVLKAFTTAKKKLNRLNIPQDNRWGIISGEFEDVMLQWFGGKESPLGDSTGKNGHIGKYMGFNLYLSNALGWSGRLEMSAVAGEDDTVVINGVTFTWNATMGSTEGSMNICNSAANEVANFVAAINTPDTDIDEAATTGFVGFSTAAYLKALSNIVATNGTTYITLKAEGKGWIAVSETLDTEADIWTTTKQIQHCLFGQGKPIDLIVQKYPNIETRDRTGYIGKDFVTWQLHGLKTFDEGDAQMVDFKVRSDSWS